MTEIIEKEPVEIISKYEVPTVCKYCGGRFTTISTDSEYVICGKCGKHQLYGYRFHFLEKSKELITADIIKRAIIDAELLYAPENMVEGTYYYIIKKIAESL